jgi:hypothetical protein
MRAGSVAHPGTIQTGCVCARVVAAGVCQLRLTPGGSQTGRTTTATAYTPFHVPPLPIVHNVGHINGYIIIISDPIERARGCRDVVGLAGMVTPV